MGSCEQSLVSLALPWEHLSQPQIYKDLTRKPLFFTGATGTSYDLQILHQWGKYVKTKSQKVFGTSCHVCRSYRGKLVGWPFSTFSPPPPPISFHPSILNRVKVISFRKFQKENFGFSQIDRKICAIINFREWSNYFISLCVFVLE